MVGLVDLIPVMVLTVKDTCLVDLVTSKTNFLIPRILKFFEKKLFLLALFSRDRFDRGRPTLRVYGRGCHG